MYNLEALERRELMSVSVGVEFGTLVVRGDGADDRVAVVIQETSEGMMASVRTGGAIFTMPAQIFDQNPRVSVLAGGGDDTIAIRVLSASESLRIHVRAGDGDDLIRYTSFSHLPHLGFLEGDDRNDRIVVKSAGQVSAYGGADNDRLVSRGVGTQKPTHHLFGGPDDDRLMDFSGGAFLHGDDGNDVLVAMGRFQGSTFDPGSGRNILRGSDESDFFLVSTGIDRIYGRGGNDSVYSRVLTPGEEPGWVTFYGGSGWDHFTLQEDSHMPRLRRVESTHVQRPFVPGENGGKG